MTIHSRKISPLAVIALIGFAAISSGSQRGVAAAKAGAGDLLVAPTRIVLEGSKRTAELNLLNIGDKPALYRISLIHQRMTEDGKLVDIETPGPGDKFADDLVRFTPRQVLLDPHVSQVVRIQLRLPANLDAGEYRSHLLFRAVSAPAATDVLPTAPPTAKGITVQITPIYGVSIPIIVRHGQTSGKSSFTDLRLTATPDGLPVLAGRMTHSGNASVYGDLVVEFAPQGKPFKQITRANGIAVYTGLSARNFALLLSGDRANPFHNGSIRVTYRMPESDGAQTIATSLVPAP